mmetsp:Transcript_50076/g.126227  ORF Transcript_50076/g.126227 Transcript_50076/m.126227 type:complete len:204 (+) Transcript_50076:803-1414(+)
MLVQSMYLGTNGKKGNAAIPKRTAATVCSLCESSSILMSVKFVLQTRAKKAINARGNHASSLALASFPERFDDTAAADAMAAAPATALARVLTEDVDAATAERTVLGLFFGRCWCCSWSSCCTPRSWRASGPSTLSRSAALGAPRSPLADKKADRQGTKQATAPAAATADNVPRRALRRCGCREAADVASADSCILTRQAVPG